MLVCRVDVSCDKAECITYHCVPCAYVPPMLCMQWHATLHTDICTSQIWITLADWSFDWLSSNLLYISSTVCYLIIIFDDVQSSSNSNFISRFAIKQIIIIGESFHVRINLFFFVKRNITKFSSVNKLDIVQYMFCSNTKQPQLKCLIYHHGIMSLLTERVKNLYVFFDMLFLDL